MSTGDKCLTCEIEKECSKKYPMGIVPIGECQYYQKLHDMEKVFEACPRIVPDDSRQSVHKIKNISVGNKDVNLEFDCYNDAINFYNWMRKRGE